MEKKNSLEEACREEIKSVSKEEYGENYRKHLLEQYKIYIQSLNHTGDLRHKVNSYFLTLNTLFLTAIGASIYRESALLSGNGGLAIPFVGVIISIIWWAITFSYKQRSIVKVNIIHCIEEYLPLSLYKVEWDVLREKRGGLKYNFFRMSLSIPWVFVLLYILIIIFSF